MPTGREIIQAQMMLAELRHDWRRVATLAEIQAIERALESDWQHNAASRKARLVAASNPIFQHCA